MNPRCILCNKEDPNHEVKGIPLHVGCWSVWKNQTHTGNVEKAVESLVQLQETIEIMMNRFERDDYLSRT